MNSFAHVVKSKERKWGLLRKIQKAQFWGYRAKLTLTTQTIVYFIVLVRYAYLGSFKNGIIIYQCTNVQSRALYMYNGIICCSVFTATVKRLYYYLIL